MDIEALALQPGSSKRTSGNNIYSYLLRKLAIVRSNHVCALTTNYIPMTRGFLHLPTLVEVARRLVPAHNVAITLEACNAHEAIELAFAR